MDSHVPRSSSSAAQPSGSPRRRWYATSAAAKNLSVAVLHGSLDRSFLGIPGVSPRLSRAGFERALALGAEGDYTLIPGAVHGIAVRAPGLGLVPLPRARRWVELVAAELERR